ncbi:pre-rRNA-processing protein tsr2 homolog [Plakobranchus ocellatus]|uniref:Pre-rRNA-processing protein TSR2 homolog n=1 Tax=Plakobranchus ocellatus TaxID=259542 RepID=A0AAV4CBN5_9GAST|nr:pre-rRNA-processing protein tsr2 homolog [Plakobranchus ocellatus]
MAAQVNRTMFGMALSKVLKSWTALQLAVEQGFGGSESSEKASWMVLAIETWFNENDGLETYEVEDFLENVLNAEFDLILEDNSIQEIARLICLFYRLSKENKIEEIQQRLQSLPQAAVQGCQLGGDQTEFDSTDESTQASALSNRTPHQPPSTSTHLQNSTDDRDSMETDEQQTEDNDGWQVIRQGRKKR